eukprot:TRINITY_DN32336_c0_g1_i1.p1 TRINITY_DN32336_c0_g1~~TRINITY_DN32336_c0_g1_i1.p1  ORF type:complete len:434 (-),score=43.38 TRINITY_DN32336_c0_g1_i1:360-1661(-)
MSTVPLVSSSCIAAALAQQRRPFILDLNECSHDEASMNSEPEGKVPGEHDMTASLQKPFLQKLGWSTRRKASEIFNNCLVAKAARWHALLTPDGIVGAYNQTRFGVRGVKGLELNVQETEDKLEKEICTDKLDRPADCLFFMEWFDNTNLNLIESGLEESNLKTAETNGPIRIATTAAETETAGQPEKAVSTLLQSCSRPRHYATDYFGIEQGLYFYYYSNQSVYLHGGIPFETSDLQQCTSQRNIPIVEHLLHDSVFEELRTAYHPYFGTQPYRMSVYASREGMQTNLHCDQHSGFLIQVVGSKRVVLIGGPGVENKKSKDSKGGALEPHKKAHRFLRCQNWGNQNAPVNRRAWFDDGIPDLPISEWTGSSLADTRWGKLIGQCPEILQCACEVELQPGQALYIPKGVFHDVLSRGDAETGETLGLVLRCQD